MNDTLLFVLLIAAIIIVMSIRVYLRRRQFKSDVKNNEGASNPTIDHSEVRDTNDAQRFVNVAHRLEDTRVNLAAATSKRERC
jgi:uncharacterized protein YneF (UPF0154 family)